MLSLGYILILGQQTHTRTHTGKHLLMPDGLKQAASQEELNVNDNFNLAICMLMLCGKLPVSTVDTQHTRVCLSLSLFIDVSLSLFLSVYVCVSFV